MPAMIWLLKLKKKRLMGLRYLMRAVMANAALMTSEPRGPYSNVPARTGTADVDMVVFLT